MAVTSVKAKAWILVEAKRGYGQPGAIIGAKVVKCQVGKPDVGPDQEAVEVEIEFPADYWETSNPKITVQVPSRSQAQATVAVQAKVKPKSPSAAAAIIHH